MKGLIMDYPLTLTHFFERAQRLFPKKILGTRVPGVRLVKYTYADFCERTARLAGALSRLGVKKGDRVGTLAWNSHRHLEVYFAAPLMGAILHTVNLRLSAQDITYIVNHARDKVLITDASLWPVVEPIRKGLKSVKHIIVMKDKPDAQIPPGALDYEARVRTPGRSPSGRSSRRPTPRACAIPRAPPGTRRVWSTPTAVSSCTPSPRPWWTCWPSPSAT